MLVGLSLKSNLIYCRVTIGSSILMANSLYSFSNDKDLSETQVYMTIHTFDKYASEYAKKWEWNPKTVSEIQKYNICPFLKYVKNGSTCLIAGCQSGRDYLLLAKAGLKCIGVSPSFGLLREALRRVPQGIFLRSDLRELPFLPDSFDSIYADALTMIPKKDIKDTLKDFKIFLRDGGCLYLSFKLGKKDSLLVMEDLGGPRFMTLFKREEVQSILEDVGFETVWIEESSHTDPELPRWLSLIVKKK